MGDEHPLERRISHYEAIDDGAGRLGAAEWCALAVTGVLFPLLCLLVGWMVGW